DVGLREQLATRMASLRGLISGVAASVAEGAREARPDEVSVSFGIELAARSGRVVGLLADGETKGAITVTLTWRGVPPEDGERTSHWPAPDLALPVGQHHQDAATASPPSPPPPRPCR